MIHITCTATEHDCQRQAFLCHGSAGILSVQFIFRNMTVLQNMEITHNFPVDQVPMSPPQRYLQENSNHCWKGLRYHEFFSIIFTFLIFEIQKYHGWFWKSRSHIKQLVYVDCCNQRCYPISLTRAHQICVCFVLQLNTIFWFAYNRPAAFNTGPYIQIP